MATREEVERFLNRFHSKLNIWEIIFVNREKNAQALLELEIASKYREEVIKEIVVEDYSEGPIIDDLNYYGEMWVFGKDVKGQEVYIKISLGNTDRATICISFHKSGTPDEVSIKGGSIMKSPFTGGEVRLMRESRELTFRKEKFAYVAHYYLCADTQEEFTTTKLDELNINQVYNQYRVKYGIPFPDEISDIRACYGLSAVKMSEILGLGPNQYRLYENGDIPSEAIGKQLRSILDPNVFIGYVKNSENQFSAPEFTKIIEKVEHCIHKIDEMTGHREVFGTCHRSEVNGYAPQSYSKLKNIILYYIDKCGGVFNTKMNKLLFYTDFLSYKLRGVGMSGLAYRAIQYGPVPLRYNLIYESIDDVFIDIVAFPSVGYSGQQLCSEIEPDISALSQEEIEILDTVLQRFKKDTSNDISEISHEEDAWKDYIGTTDFISYNKAFSLKAL